ncbi:alpha/beta hydrolase [Pendulispora rubella]|uniref:Alpha/beta hydrolase n=1 Tax=Pendulispora rubella TaxID=2741070 RepID=A0ABZ2LAH5_9BACT
MNVYSLERPLAWSRAYNPFYSGRSGIRIRSTPSGQVRLRHEGEGSRTIVFVCDTPVFIEHYDRLFELLSPRFKVLCLELPGMGFSKPVRNFDYSLRSQAQAVWEVLEAEDVEECILSFSCVGAYLALIVASMAPSIVRGVVSIQAPSWEQERAWARRIDFRGRGLVATPVLGQLLLRAGKRKIAERWFHSTLGKAANKQQFVDTAIGALDAGSPWALASMVQAYFSHATPTFPTVQQKSLVIWGGGDGSHRKSDPESAIPYFREARLMRFEQAGHCPDLEEPQRFAEALALFSAEL